jgi:hypothetical protein
LEVGGEERESEICGFRILQAPEECREGQIDALEHLLKHLRVHIVQLRRYFFNLRQLVRLIVIADGLARELIGTPALGKRSIVEFPAEVQGSLKLRFLGLSGIQPVLESFLHSVFSLSLNVVTKMKRVRAGRHWRWFASVIVVVTNVTFKRLGLDHTARRSKKGSCYTSLAESRSVPHDGKFICALKWRGLLCSIDKIFRRNSMV